MKFNLSIIFTFFILNAFSQNFQKDQLRYQRVRTAKAETDESLRNAFAEKELTYPPNQILLRAFKEEDELELWVKEENQWCHFKTYDICAASGKLGPKRKQGDFQVPEGFYYINRFNPNSNFHLSLGINYPNASDKVLSDRSKPGGDIFIHGNCVSIGCMAMEDENIKEIYWLAVQAKNKSNKRIYVHIFPFKMNSTLKWKMKTNQFPEQKSFWENLKEGYNLFELFGILPEPRINKSGKYYSFN